MKQLTVMKVRDSNTGHVLWYANPDDIDARQVALNSYITYLSPYRRYCRLKREIVSRYGADYELRFVDSLPEQTSKPELVVVKQRVIVSTPFGIDGRMIWYANPDNPTADGIIPLTKIQPCSPVRQYCYRKTEVKRKFGSKFTLIFKEK